MTGNTKSKYKREIFKKASISVLVFLLLISSFFIIPVKTNAQELSIPDLNSKAALLMEFSRGEIIMAKNSSEIMAPASLTKIMTIVLAYEALKAGRVTWEENVIISQKSWETGGSQMFLEIGQAVSFGDLVTGIAAISANDACVAIAEHLYGSEEFFVQEMNKKARELGMKNSLFQNSSGLPHPEHYTTAEDVAVVTRHLISNFPEHLKLHSQTEFTFNDIKQYNRNPLLGRYPGADGLKTGHTAEAGHCLVGTATQGGLRFITVTLNASSTAERLKDTETMLNYAFRNYILKSMLPQDEIITTIRVTGGEERQINLVLDQPAEVAILFERQEDLEIRYNVPESVPAPLEKGEMLGKVEILLDGELLLETPLLAETEINKAGFVSLMFRSFADFFSNLWEKAIDTLGGLF
ncbi:MAG: D-alanyl-D-alanine carboxypeptidase family protein [Bacillota bacterium]|nr:D-alanyl-D-alanine carboxypeptidase family protein [Bacillota bacterium]